VLDSGRRAGHCDFVALTPDNLDKVMTELVAVSRSAMSKREEAVNLARIWGREDAEVRAQIVRATKEPGAEFRALPASIPARWRRRWRRVA
jgi:hypothetical protein